jgi:hypothetical protein
MIASRSPRKTLRATKRIARMGNVPGVLSSAGSRSGTRVAAPPPGAHDRRMKPRTVLASGVAGIASFAASFVPTLAYACPGSACGCATSSFSHYASAVGIGILAGIGSVSFEKMWRARRR